MLLSNFYDIESWIFHDSKIGDFDSVRFPGLRQADGKREKQFWREKMLYYTKCYFVSF